MKKVNVLLAISVLVVVLVIGGCALWGGGTDEVEKYIIAFDQDQTAKVRTVQGLLDQSIKVLEQFSIIDAVLAELTPKQVKWIEKNLPVKYIEKDMIMGLPEPVEPEEPVNMLEDTEIGWEIKMINAQEAWERSKGEGVLVGVIDTGVDATHPDLAGAVVGGYNGLTDSDEGWADDNGHGTSVAGAIAGRLNGTGIVGIAPLANIFALKGLSASGYGSVSALLRCFQKALAIECDMVNCSWGSGMESQAISDAMQNLAAWQGMGVVCAAGNSNKSPIIWPARHPVAVCVTAVDTYGKKASFSSYGEAVKKNGVAAPGDWVLAAKMGGGTRRVSGTSIATPYVTGLLAITKAMHWPWRKWIFKGASQYETPDVYLGHGIIDAKKTIDAMTTGN